MCKRVNGHERVRVVVDEGHDAHHVNKFLFAVNAVTEFQSLRILSLQAAAALAFLEKTFEILTILNVIGRTPSLLFDGHEKLFMQELLEVQQSHLFVESIHLWDFDQLNAHLSRSDI